MALEPYYQDSSISLYLGDCREVLPQLSIVADICVTDPPYENTSLQWDSWPDGWLETTAACLPDVTSLWCFGSMRMHLKRRDEFMAEFTYGQEIVWEKHNGSAFHTDRFRRVHEIAVHWYRGSWNQVHTCPQFTHDARARTARRNKGPAHTGAIDGRMYTSVEGGPRLMRSVLKVRSMHGKAIHPTEKPEGILTPIINYSCPEQGVVLDPFAGSGAVLRAAALSGRNAVGVESNEKYCAAAAQRLSQGHLDFGAVS